ncbi:MAG: extracellular solute-binding protein [Clostridiales bacterium]|jgi:raffinose/stachyose/melibiose transport system substrate-binding protein|nr:extracellular solute-binding protein [Clostridiales bacterium]
MKTCKKILALALSLMLMATAIAGCASPTGANPPAAPADGTSVPAPQAPADAGPKKETLRVITYFAGSDQWVPVWKEVIAEYQTQNPHITISDESVPTAGTNDVFRPKMNADIAANTPTDLALYFNGSDAKPLLDSGMYVTWESYLAADPAWNSQFVDGALPAGECEGQLISLPYIGFFEGLTYNAKIFRDYSLDPPDSWENILKAVEVLAKTDIIPISTSLLNPTVSIETMVLAEVGPDAQKKIADPSWAPALDRFKVLYEMNAFPKDAATLADADSRPLFVDGRAAMSFNGSWVLNSLRDNPDMRIIAVNPPPGSSGTKGAIVAGFGSGWYMSKQAAQRSEESLKFVKYMCSPEILSRFIQVGGSAAMKIELPPDTEPVLLSATEMVSAASSMSNPIDAQMPREAFNKLAKDLIYVCEGEKTSIELLEEVKELIASAS